MTHTDYRYARKLTPTEAGLVLEIHDRRRLRGNLPAQAREAARRYGFNIDGVTDERGVRHLLVVWDGPLDSRVLQTTQRRIGLDVDTASIAFAYPDEAASRAAVPHIETAKVRTHDRLNVIRPDRHAAEGVFVSNHKLLQTMVAETVRVRYRPYPLSDRMPASVRDRVLPFFLAAARRIARDRMWSRGPCDGCIAIRCPEGVVVTATQTNKAPLEVDRLVLVHSYDEASDTVTYSGPALPSTDCVELMVLANRRPDLRAFVHTHASALITRNTRFAGGLRLGVRVSGEPALGHELAEVLPHGADTLVVLKEHGELFAGASDDADFFEWFQNVCANARRTLSWTWDLTATGAGLTESLRSSI